MLDNENTQLPAPRVPVVDATTRVMERSWYRFFANFYNYFIDLPYGSFFDTSTQTATANTPTAITFNSSDGKQHIAIGTPTSRITFQADSFVNVAFSIQFWNSSASEDDVYVWLRKNGTDVVYSASAATVAKKHGTDNGAALVAVNFYLNIVTGDYLELYWLTVNGTSTIATIPATLSPAKPASPGVVLTIGPVL